MPRPRLCRRVRFNPGANFFKPRGIPMAFLQEVVLSVDEFEAIRLADLEGSYQDEGAKKMGVSRQTFGRILEGAHKKIAECLVQGKALRIEGGDYIMLARKFVCAQCEHLWEVPHGLPRPSECPQCGSTNIHRSKEERPIDDMSSPGAGRRGFGRGPGRGAGRGGRRGPGREQGRYCFCPKCGYKKPHVRGTPCQDEKCPTCGVNLLREGSYHDYLLKKKKGGK